MLGNLAIAPARYFSYASAFALGVFPCQARAMTGFPGRAVIAASPRESPALGSAPRLTIATATDTAVITAFMNVTSDRHCTAGNRQHRPGRGQILIRPR